MKRYRKLIRAKFGVVDISVIGSRVSIAALPNQAGYDVNKTDLEMSTAETRRVIAVLNAAHAAVVQSGGRMR